MRTLPNAVELLGSSSCSESKFSSIYRIGTFHFLCAPPPYGRHFFVLSSVALSESVTFASIGEVGIAILAITDPPNHFFSQSPFTSENRVVGIFILQSGGVGISLLFFRELEYLFFDFKRHQK